ncbi:MAG: helix-turn-helix transcriptional regulator [Edaphocola sp.]
MAQIRLGKNISQADLARSCDKDPQSLNRIEKGRVNPSVNTLKEIADMLEVNVRDFFDF